MLETVPSPPPLFNLVFAADLSVVATEQVLAVAELAVRSSPDKRSDNLKELTQNGTITLCTCGRDLAETLATAASNRIQHWASRSPRFANHGKPLFSIKVIKNV